MPLLHAEAGDGLLTMLAETVRHSLDTVEAQRSRFTKHPKAFARIEPAGQRKGAAAASGAPAEPREAQWAAKDG